MPLLTAGPSRFLGGGNVTWLLRDEFTSDLAAGAVNGTAAEPGPGTRTVASDTNSTLTITSGLATFATGSPTSYADPSIRYDSVVRTPGRLLIARLTAAFTDKLAWFGFNDSTTITAGSLANATHAVKFVGGGVLEYVENNTVVINAGTYSAGVACKLALILRAAGSLVLINTNSGGWRLLSMHRIDTTTPVFPVALANYSNTITVDWIRIPDTVWLPTPLVSDSFASAFGTSDGLGHAEGIATGIGAGGGGVAWTQQVGTWEVASGKAKAATLDGGIAVATASLTTANVVIGAACVRSAGDVGVVLSWSDSSNYVRALHNGTNVQLIKTVAGTPTTLVNAAATYSAGARLVVTKDSTKYRVYYNNALVGTEQTIADAGIVSNTLHGLFSTDAGNTLDDFVIFARGNEGQYAELDRYSGS